MILAVTPYTISITMLLLSICFLDGYFPGSEINVVWKNSIFSDDESIDQTYWNNLFDNLQDGPMNTFSIKLIYWLDAQYLKK